ncbi:MAG: glycosyltransferase family 2 protein [Thaumarchaeota archaeon]|nr:glycosyltransferase family 2 protein [Nitrososphaerota archaeon]MBI3641310.1 glycosyltransferase family 2 protein [Nitrososphaerota archaeon]
MKDHSKPLVSIVILNYNAGDLLLNCVESIFKTKYDNYEVILVDNASKDDSHKKTKEKFSKIRLIENKENLGYCEGNNVGIRDAKGDFIVILNPDTKAEPNWLEELFKGYNKYGEGLYQPKILAFENQVFESAGNMLHLFGFGYPKGRGSKDIGQYEQPASIGYASGACLFTSSNILKKIGLFDPFLFLYHDDLDLGWRAAQIGIKSYYIPTAIIYHLASYNLKWSAKKFFWLERNRHYCLLTHYSKKTFYKMLPSLIIVEIMVFIFYISKGFFKMKISAYIDIIKNREFISKKFHELESKKTVPDFYLIKNFPNEILLPEAISTNFSNKVFNFIFANLSKLTKRFI